MGCGASASTKITVLDVSTPNENNTLLGSPRAGKSSQAATTTEVAQGRPLAEPAAPAQIVALPGSLVAAVSPAPLEARDAADGVQERMVAGLADAAISAASSNPAAAAGLAAVAAAIAEGMPVAGSEPGVDPAVASGLAAAALAAANAGSASATGLVKAAASTSVASARARSQSRDRKGAIKQMSSAGVAQPVQVTKTAPRSAPQPVAQTSVQNAKVDSSAKLPSTAGTSIPALNDAREVIATSLADAAVSCANANPSAAAGLAVAAAAVAEGMPLVTIPGSESAVDPAVAAGLAAAALAAANAGSASASGLVLASASTSTAVARARSQSRDRKVSKQ